MDLYSHVQSEVPRTDAELCTLQKRCIYFIAVSFKCVFIVAFNFSLCGGKWIKFPVDTEGLFVELAKVHVSGATSW